MQFYVSQLIRRLALEPARKNPVTTWDLFCPSGYTNINLRFLRFPMLPAEISRNLAHPSCQAPVKSVLWVLPNHLSFLVAFKEISLNAAAAAVLSEQDCIFTLKEEKRKIFKVFLGGKEVYVLWLATGFGENLVKHGGVSRLATRWCHVCSILTSIENL